MINEAPPDPPELHQILKQFSGFIAYDIGANVGSTAKLLARSFARVVALEPADESFVELKKLSSDAIVCLQCAASGKSGVVELVERRGNIDTGQLVDCAAQAGPDWGDILDIRSVPATTIDSLSGEYGAPDFIKVDVEGHEVEVLRGGLTTLETFRPSLYLEIHNADLGAQVRALLDSWYPDLREVFHPYYSPSDWGAKNHYWLVSS